MDSKVVSAKCKKCLDAYRSDISLNIQIGKYRGLIRWELGPYQTGRYLFVDPQTGFTITLPRSGYIPGTIDMIAKTEKNYMCYAAPEGWIACSTWSPSAPKPE
jgi:type IV secretory pathway protease TraF